MRMLDVFIMFDLINNNLSPFKSEEDDISQNPVLRVRHSLVSDSVARPADLVGIDFRRSIH